ncbi:MAG TPA: hypothetical protein VIU61_17330 [Kofleriaceae bacterium]
MSGSRKKLETTEASTEDDTQEVYLRDGRKLSVSEQGKDQLVEIRNESGMLELRIKLTEEGPVLQMESVRLQLKASEAVEIESPRVEIKGTEQLELSGGQVTLSGEEDVKVDAKGEVRVKGKMIWLN